MKDYEQVSAERLKQICREVFRSENMVLAVEGKPSRIDLARLKQIREHSF
jgi:predicted Zn-dependent peptidase